MEQTPIRPRSPSPLDTFSDDQDFLPFAFADDLFGPSKNRPHLTHRQRRELNCKATVGTLDLSAEELQRLQQADPSIASLQKTACTDASLTSGYFIQDGLLCHWWKPGGSSSMDVPSTVDQLALPTYCWSHALHLAHSIPLAGHLVVAKTTQRILHRFYWPTLHRNVKNFCQACHECQKTSTRRSLRALLVPLPIMDEPFQRIGMDLVGPLPRTSAGQPHIPLICDYGTRYPEAVPLKYIKQKQLLNNSSFASPELEYLRRYLPIRGQTLCLPCSRSYTND